MATAFIPAAQRTHAVRTNKMHLFLAGYFSLHKILKVVHLQKQLYLLSVRSGYWVGLYTRQPTNY